MKPVTDIQDPRLVKALAHPLRVRILGLLESRTMTPKAIAAELGMRLENVSYHVRILRDFGFIKLERKKQVRGAIEHHYRAVARPRITTQAWTDLPAVVQDAMTRANLSHLMEMLGSAAEQDGFARAETQLTHRHLLVDGLGYTEASIAMAEVFNELTRIERDAAHRIRMGAAQGEETRVIAAALLFNAPEGGNNGN